MTVFVEQPLAKPVGLLITAPFPIKTLSPLVEYFLVSGKVFLFSSSHILFSLIIFFALIVKEVFYYFIGL